MGKPEATLEDAFAYFTGADLEEDRAATGVMRERTPHRETPRLRLIATSC